MGIDAIGLLQLDAELFTEQLAAIADQLLQPIARALIKGHGLLLHLHIQLKGVGKLQFALELLQRLDHRIQVGQ